MAEEGTAATDASAKRISSMGITATLNNVVSKQKIAPRQQEKSRRGADFCTSQN